MSFGTSAKTPYTQGSGNIKEESTERFSELQDEGTCCKSLSSRYDNKDVPLKSQQYSCLTKIAKWQHQLAYQMEEKFHKSLLLAEKLQRINDCWKEELV